jgi:uncharacterized membrane protein
MNGSPTFVILRLLHIVTGALWVGAALLLSNFILPSVRALGPGGGPLMNQLAQVRKLPIYMMAMAMLAMLSGLLIYWMNGQSFGSSWLASTPGRVFGLGGALAIAAGILGMALTSPAGKRMGELGAAIQAGGKPPTPEQVAEMQRLQARIGTTSKAVAVLVVLATVCMATARYTG